MAVRVAINGFGRIGRTILRLLATTRAGADVQVVAVNDKPRSRPAPISSS